MALFQKSVLNNYLKLQDKELLEKAFRKYTKYFHNLTIQENIKSSKEEQYQAKFLDELFVNILGYVMNPKPNYNLTTEFKNLKNARKADGAILKDDQAIAVIELKGTGTKDLESIRKQAFDYKANQKGCKYVVTSNFEKLRFYINDATDFEDFDLFSLSLEKFELLYLCLHKDNLYQDLPSKIKEKSVTEEEQITKKFYTDYSVFKRELFHDLVKQNAKQLKNNTVTSSEVEKSPNLIQEQQRIEKNVKLALFKKSQKLIDRFLFIFFAEDRNLLPANSTIKILEDWNKLKDLDAEVPLYNRFKLYFKYLEQGRKGTDKKAEIYAYNGGLFKPDSILDSLTIDDDLLYKHTLQLANYDFDSQVDVNILGHIFENSLNEIESVNAEIEGGKFDKQKSKRKKDGVFYTPKYITKYIVENTVGKLCKEKKLALGFKEEEYYKSRKGRQETTLKKLIQILDDYRTWLLQLTICDPACGSGAFLNQALDFLIKEHTYIDELKTKLLGGSFTFPDIENTILENNIYGVDLNEESVEIAKLSLWLRTAQPKRKLNDLSSNIKCGNSLIDSKAIAGNKAFNWEEEFPQIFKEKHKKAYHITTAIHDSRTSKRMLKYKVRERREMGTNPYPNVIYFTPEDDLLITKTIAEIVAEDQLNILAYNICADHIHLLLVCDLAEIPAIMQKIKSITAKKVNATRKHTVTREHAPLREEKAKANKPLWQQKYSAPKEIITQEQLTNTIKYIQTNRNKHELPEHSKDVESFIQDISCTTKKAFSNQYSGGFDVVIGNPPYVQVTENKSYYESKYKTNNCGDLYALFYEKGIYILKDKGILSFITPSLFIKGIRYESLRSYLINNTQIIEIMDKGDGVFQEVQMPTAILTAIKKYFNGQIWEHFLPNFELINKIERDSLQLSKISKIKRGLEIGKDKVFEFSSDKIKIITGEDVSRYFIKEYKSIEISTYEKFKKDEEYFNSERCVIRETGNRITALYVNENVQQNRSLYSIILSQNNYKYILGIINSSLIQFYYKSKYAANTDVFPKIRISQVKELPIKLNDNYSISKEVNNIINNKESLFDVISKFQNYLKQKFQLHKLPKKLQNWQELEFADFIKELNKAQKAQNKLQKISNNRANIIAQLTKKDEFEWLDLFKENKQKAQDLQTQINNTDKKIDAMVYELYCLSKEEIAIVEKS